MTSLLGRLRPLERLLLTLGLPLWLAALALSVHYSMRGRIAWLLLGAQVEAPADARGYPRIGALAPGTTWWDIGWAEASGLEPGDRLIRIGDADLRGAGPIGVFARAAEQAGDDQWVSVVVERRGETRHGDWQLQVPPRPRWWWDLPPVLAWMLVSVMALLRAPGARGARVLFRAVLCGAIAMVPFGGGPHAVTYVSLGLAFGASILVLPLALQVPLLLPADIHPPGRRRLASTWLVAPVLPLTWAGLLFGVPFSFGVAIRAQRVLAVVFVIVATALWTESFRRSGPVGRRQIKWIVLGVYASAVPSVAAGIAVLRDPGLFWLPDAARMAGLIVPLCVLVSVVRANLFDIDRLFGAVLSYSVVVGVLVAIGLALVPGFAEAAGSAMGVDPMWSRMVLAVLLGAAVVPAYRGVRPRIDRMLFADRYAIDQGMAQLLEALTGQRTLEALTAVAGETLVRLFRPDSCVIFARAGAGYVPVFAHGRAVPGALDGMGPLVAAVRDHTAPIVTQTAAEPEARRPGPFARAVLEALDAAVVVPIRREEELTAFLSLGRKGSNDIYTSTDVTLLAAVASKLGSELRHLHERDVLEQTRALQEALRRYVPGAVASELASGRALEPVERDVTVIFVDLRGFTALSESRQLEDVFSTVNRYTETLSSITRAHGGTVVEFSGDGMMVLFGAPTAHAAKEQAAIAAGREMVTAVASLESGALAVGVGIATGRAVVGNVQAVDRFIWTAIGTTVNLAARLQALTRTLDAALIVDATTWERAGSPHDLQRYAAVEIRGLSAPRDVYALPLR